MNKIFGLAIIIGVIIAAFVGIPTLNSILTKPIAEGTSTSTENMTERPLILEGGLTEPRLAPALKGITGWINSPPLSPKDLQGKVVLLDFWTYSCIHCVRTLPYLKKWHEAYHKDGLVIIGVHTPEFEFEKNINNVMQAVNKYDIKYPVALDNEYITWINYYNQYRPAHYLIDKQGRVVYSQMGESDHTITENNIRFLLGRQDTPSPTTAKQENSTDPRHTPETYLGYARSKHFSGHGVLSLVTITDFSYPPDLPIHGWALQGVWRTEAEKIVAEKPSPGIRMHFLAGKVFVVAGSARNHPIKVKVLLDGKPLDHEGGKDLKTSTLTVLAPTLYEVINLKQPREGTLELLPESDGLELYTFTFGN